MKLQGIGIRSLAAVARDPRRSTSERERCLGWLGTECTKASAAASGRRKMSLDIPFYRTPGIQHSSSLSGSFPPLDLAKTQSMPSIPSDTRHTEVRYYDLDGNKPISISTELCGFTHSAAH